METAPMSNSDLEKMIYSSESPVRSRQGIWNRENPNQDDFNPYIIFSSEIRGETPLYSVTIQVQGYGGRDKPYPVFPFFQFELIEKNGQKYIIPTQSDRSRVEPFGFSEIPYKFEQNTLLIQGKVKLIVPYGQGQDEIELEGRYIGGDEG